MHLQSSLFRISPLVVPDVLVVRHLGHHGAHRILVGVEPQLAEGGHRGRQPVDHPEDPDHGPEAVDRAQVEVGPVQVERAVGGLLDLTISTRASQVEALEQSQLVSMLWLPQP